MTNGAGWSEAQVLRVAAQMQAIRKDLGLTAAQLSDRTEQFGKRISRAVISDLETGRKKSLELADVIILAAALDVPPIQMIYPGLPDGDVEVWPGVDVRSFDAVQWFSGERGLGRNGLPNWFADSVVAFSPVGESRRISTAREEWFDAFQRVTDLENHIRANGEDSPDAVALTSELAPAKQIEGIRREALAGRLALAIMEDELTINLGQYPQQIVSDVEKILSRHSETDLDLFRAALARGESLSGSDERDARG